MPIGTSITSNLWNIYKTRITRTPQKEPTSAGNFWWKLLEFGVIELVALGLATITGGVSEELALDYGISEFGAEIIGDLTESLVDFSVHEFSDIINHETSVTNTLLNTLPFFSGFNKVTRLTRLEKAQNDWRAIAKINQKFLKNKKLLKFANSNVILYQIWQIDQEHQERQAKQQKFHFDFLLTNNNKQQTTKPKAKPQLKQTLNHNLTQQKTTIINNNNQVWKWATYQTLINHWQLKLTNKMLHHYHSFNVPQSNSFNSLLKHHNLNRWNNDSYYQIINLNQQFGCLVIYAKQVNVIIDTWNNLATIIKQHNLNVQFTPSCNLTTYHTNKQWWWVRTKNLINNNYQLIKRYQ